MMNGGPGMKKGVPEVDAIPTIATMIKAVVLKASWHGVPTGSARTH